MYCRLLLQITTWSGNSRWFTNNFSRCMMNARLFSLLACTCLLSFTFSCKHSSRPDKGSIKGTLQHAGKTMIYLERFTDQGEQKLDSAMTDADGHFEMGNKATDPVYYGLRTD